MTQGDSVPVHQSPVKEDIPAVPVTASIPTPTTATASAQRSKTLRSRIQSYKIDSEESGDDKVVQIQASSSHHVTAPQIQTQTTVVSGLKRGIQRTIPSQISKRTKLSTSASNDGLELSDSTTSQVQTVQIVKQLPAQVIESEYIELPIESINPKAEPDYTEETAEIETVDAETEQDNKLSEQGDQGDADDEGNYVEDEAYGEMGISKYDDSYLTEGEDGGKPSVSGFVDSYTSDGGTGTEQSTQALPLANNNGCNGLASGSPTINPIELKFIKSPWSTLCLVLNDFLYNCHSTRGDIGYWRCHNYSRKVKEERCRARCVVKSGRLSAFTGAQHNHPPHTEKIERIVRRNHADEQQELQLLHMQQQQQQESFQRQRQLKSHQSNEDIMLLMAEAQPYSENNSQRAVNTAQQEQSIIESISQLDAPSTPAISSIPSILPGLTEFMKMGEYGLPTVGL